MIKKCIISAIFLAFFLLFACNKDDAYQFKKFPSGPIKHHLIVVAKTQNGLKARGFQGATPPNTQIYFKAGSAEAKTTSKTDGSFAFEVSGNFSQTRADEFSFDTGEKIVQTSYSLKDLPTSLAAIAKPRFDLDFDTQSVSFMKDKIAILASNAALVSSFEITSDWSLPKEPSSVLSLHLDKTKNLGAQMISGVNRFAVVPLFATSEIILIDLHKNRLLSTERLKQSDGKLYTFNLTPPLKIDSEIDADGSGTMTNVITRSFAHQAQSVLALDDTHFLVGFANYYQIAGVGKATTSVMGPGIVALLNVEDESLVTKSILHVDFLNPQYFVRSGDDTVWLSCSGVWESTAPPKTRSAGLVKLKIDLSKNSLQIEKNIALNDFAPTRPAVLKNKIVVPQSWGNQIAILDDNATSFADAKIVSATFSRPLLFTLANHWHDDIVMLGDDQGTLIAYSLSEGWFPFPFVEPIKLEPNKDPKIPLAPQALYFRHQHTNHKLTDDHIPGYSAYVEIASHNKLIPLDMNELFGP